MRVAATIVLLLAAGTARAQFTAPPACMDGLDNDGDGKKDYDVRPGFGDPGCDAWNDTSEADLTYTPKVKARLAIIFDTSGSMIWNVCTTNDTGLGYTGGDGSNDCPGHDVACCHTPPEPPAQCLSGQTPVHNLCDSSTCGNGAADDARLFKVKQGVFQAVAAYGELEYALYRFHADARTFVTCDAVNPNGTGPFGGWAGAPDGDSCKPSDLLVKFAPENTNLVLQWMDQDSNWSGAGNPPVGMDFELRGTGFTPLGASLEQAQTDIHALRVGDPARMCRPYRVVLVTDGRETCGGDPEAAAASLRADGALVYVIGFTSNEGFLQDAMNAIAAAGGTGEAFLVDNPASLSAALAQIAQETVLVETCNGMDDDCDGLADNGFNLGECDNGELGECFHQGSFVCAGPFQTECNAPPGVPESEEAHGCNGKDDDCDGIVDDGLNCQGCGQEICNGADDDCNGTADDGQDMPGVGDPCQLDVGACSPGTYACEGGRLVCKDFIGPTPEICDNIDNDCNGVVDQISRPCYDAASGCIDADPSQNGVRFECKGRCRPGSQTCTAGAFGACTGQVGPTTELCNGVDDDCDGETDEGFTGLGNICAVGMGLCRATGKFVCGADGRSVVCDAPVITGSDEVCNDLDDDCNGAVDDLPVPPPPPIGEPCGTCGGHFACRGGLVCEGGAATFEVCNGLDDDCNNLVDDGDMPEVGDTCVPGPPGAPDFQLLGQCRPGTKVCAGGKLECVNYTGPQPEVCNGLDDDCDGTTDDMAACPSPNDVCFEAQCVSPCGNSEFPCPTFGTFCKQLPEGRYCVPSKCVDKVCDPGQVCDPETGACKDPCAGVTCPAGAVCRLGRCVDCFQLGCPTGQVCIAANPGGVGACVEDRCAGVSCPVGEACVDGACAAVPCPGGCERGQVCDDGECVSACAANLCFGANCAAGFACDPASGRCISDPCAHAACGAEADCVVGCQGRATCSLRPSVTVLATGSGGFSCEIGAFSTGGGGGGAALLALWALVVAAAGRRRRR